MAATPELEPALRATTQEWTANHPRVGDKCVVVEVKAAESADVAAAIAAQGGTTLPGLTPVGGDVRVPDVWIPDSSIWVQRVKAAVPDAVVGEAPSVARSPVVLAMPQPVAASVGLAGGKLTWPALLSKLTSGTAKLRSGIVDPNRDAASASGLLALAGAAQASGGAAGQQATVATLRTLASGRSALRADLLARFPRGADGASLASALMVAPLSEQSVITYNAGQPAVPLAALYVEPAPAPLDYPFAVLARGSQDQAAAARAVLGALRDSAYRDRLAGQGLRAGDGSAGAGFAAPASAPAGPAPAGAQPDPQIVAKLLDAWSTLVAPGRMLSVLDVSGSMVTKVPTAGNATREQVAVQASLRGLALMDDNWAVGLWTFSTQLEGNNDYKQLVPIGPLPEQRTTIQNALATIKPKPNGGTGLYNTIFAAYKYTQSGWDPSRVNSIVIMTDGKNEQAAGLTLDQLIAELKKIVDPARPIQVIAIGIGNEVSEPELKRITDTTGGGTFVAPDPAKIGDIFFQAIGKRATPTR
ncbi:VWA domain-containing protein [Planosporangium mesophilum]|nr:VWA domain-containing protein [Planosporangium mesophilum]